MGLASPAAMLRVDTVFWLNCPVKHSNTNPDQNRTISPLKRWRRFWQLRKLPPLKSRGYYLEYTVKTLGRRDRGARRIIAGEGAEYHYTDDHYKSFRRIQE